MHRHLVHSLRPRVGLGAAALLVLALGIPRGLTAQVPADVRQAAADRVWIRQYLRLYDQTLTIQAALGQITGAQADAQLAAAGRELHDTGFYNQDMDAVRDALREAARPFFAGIEQEIASSTTWPADMPAEAYRSLSTRLLNYARSGVERELARGADPTAALRAATLVLAWARGYEGLPEDLDYFSGTRDRAAGAVPGIELMPIEGGAAPALPPPPGVRPPINVTPATPTPGVGGGGRPGLATRVLLRAGMVEGQARLLGESSMDVVGKTTRPRGDGAADTEIELRILARGFTIENIEVRSEPTGGRMVDRTLGTWSSRPASRRPLAAVYANRGLLNRANGELGAIVLGDLSVLNLYIQDDGQLEASADPGTVVVYFRGGERAAFPIALGGPIAQLGAGGRPAAPTGGAGGAPPTVLAGLPPRTPGAPGGPVTPPAGGGPTIPRNLPPPMPGGVPPVTRPPVGQQPGAGLPATPTGGGPVIRPPITPPPASMPPPGGRPPVTPPTVAQPPVTPPAAGAAPARLSAFQAAWVGMDADVVSKGAEARPDGSLDGHIRITATFTSWQDITHVALYSSDASGTPAGGQVWHSQNGGYWLLAAMAQGMNLNVRHLPTLGKFNGNVTLDLYAGDSGYFTAGRTFLVEMGMGPGQAVAQVVRVGAGAAPPVTPPVTPPVVTGGGGAPPGATTVDWGTTATNQRPNIGQRFSYPCPPGGSARTVWGTGTYTDDSSICTAAVHAGLITFAGGGTVTIEIRPGQSAYTGSPGYGGVTSSNYGSWSGSFAFAGAGGAAPPVAESAVPGTTWTVTTLEGWSAVWTRRSGNTFDVVWSRTGSRITGTMTLVLRGGQVFGQEAPKSDGYACEYTGALEANGTRASGTYVCPTYDPNRVWPWNAVIDAPVTPPPTTFAGTIQTDKASYGPGETITVTFTNFPGTNDWIAIAPTGAAPESYGEWKWTDGSSTSGRPAGPPRRDGMLTFTAPAAGTYEARVFIDWSAGGHRVRAMRPFTVVAGPTFVSLPADWPATWQWTSDGGWTGTWTRRGTSDVFDAAYQNGGTRVSTVEEMTWSGQQVRVRRVSSSDNILCNLEGAITSSTRIEGTGSCPTTTSGWRWSLTVAAGPPAIAGGAPVTQSSVSTWSGTNDPSEDAQGAVDGVKNGSFGFHTDNTDPRPWWRADLGTVAPLREIRVYNRMDCCQERARTLQILLSSDGSNWELAYAHDGSVIGGATDSRPLIVDLRGRSARWVLLQLNEAVYFHLDEVEIVRADGQAGAGATPGAATTDWNTTATDHRQQIGQRFTYACPPNGSQGRGPWGTDIYTDDSSVCTAAVHAGLITYAAGGTVVIEVRADPGRYTGSNRNGVASADYGAWTNAFVFVGAGGTVPPSGNACGRTLGTGILGKWQSLGGEGGFLGCPTSDEQDAAPSPQGTTGRWTSFAGANGLIVWMRSGQAYEVHGDISVLYYGMGGTASWLGFPVSDEYEVAGGRRSDFEGGYILWTAANRETKAYPHGQGPTAAFAGQIYADRQSYAAGETITVTFTNFPGTNDWIAMAAVGATAEQYGEWHWTEQRTAGTMTFTAPAEGSYELRAYANWPDAGYTVVATYPIQVGGAAAGGGYPRDLLVAYDAAWVGMDVDGVGAGGYGPPDGAADGHFTFDIDINTNYEVRYISVYSTDAQGNPAGGQIWTTQSSGSWPLAVYLQGSRLNDGHVASLGTHSGRRRFELAAANSGYFNDGQHFVVEADVGLSEPLRRIVQVSGGGGGGGAGQTGGGSCDNIYVPATSTESSAVTSPCVLQAGQWYVLEASSTIGMWGDGNADRVDAVWCYNPYPGWESQCQAPWDVLRVDGHGLSEYSAAAGGPSPLPYDPRHVYRVYVQGQGNSVRFFTSDTQPGDNTAGFTVRITAQDGQPVGGGGQPQDGQPLGGQPQAGQPQGGQIPSGTFQGRWQIYSCVDASGANVIDQVVAGTLSVALDGQGGLSGVLSVSLSLFGEAARDFNLPYTGSYDARTLYGTFNSRNGGSIQMTGDYTLSGGALSMPSVTLEARDAAGSVTRCAGSAAFP